MAPTVVCLVHRWCRWRQVPFLMLAVGLVARSSPVTAQTLRGIVRDSVAAAPLSDVRIELTGVDLARLTFSDGAGGFAFVGIPGGAFRLRFTRVGYAPRVLEGVRVDGGPIEITLLALGAPLDPVVISASRREEAALDAPAAVTVLDRAAVAEAPTLEPLNQVARAPGVNAAQKGLVQQTFSARGANTVNSGALLMLHDFRYAALPSVAFNLPYLIPATAEDLDRIEIIRGPAAALYGPGAPAGVVHLLTRSPLDERGGSVTLTGGTRAVLSGGLRYSARVTPTLAVKVSGEYLRARDWSFLDSAEVSNRAAAIAAGADPDTLLVGTRDSTLERAIGDLRLDWRPAIGTDVVVAAGAAQALRAIDLTPAVAAIQGRDWRYSYAQLRARHGRLTANVLYNWSDAGETYVLRSGNRLVDDSRVIVTQAQHGLAIGSADLLYGADLRWTDPRTGGTIHGINEDDDLVTEIGGYLHADVSLTPQISTVGALRVDHHDRLNDLVLSPRLGLVVRPAPTHALRLTYNRAFTSPDANDLFLDIEEARFTLFPGIGYAVRGVGVPKDGFTFRRDCDGRLCMRSPFNFAAPGAYLPADATRLWPAVVLLADRQGFDLSQVPPPDASQVRTILAALDPSTATPTFVPVDPADVADLRGEGRTITNALEVGYKGVWAALLEIAVDLWGTRVENIAGPLVTATPNAFFDEASLRDYLAGYLPADSAAALAATVSRIPAGTVSPQETAYPHDLLVVNRRGGAYTLWGIDVAATVAPRPGLTLSVSYSWTSNDTIPDVPDIGTVYLNTPRSRGTAGLSYRHLSTGATFGARGRWVTAFRANSGRYDGAVEGYIVMDVAVGSPVPRWRAAGVQLVAQNLIGGRHREMVGAPEVGRLFLARLRIGF